MLSTPMMLHLRRLSLLAAVVLLPGCVERSRLSNQSSRIISQRKTYDALQEYYAEPMKLLQRIKKSDDGVRDAIKRLREHIMIRSDEYARTRPWSWLPWYNTYEHLPFHSYKQVMDSNIEVLEREITHQRVHSDTFSRQVRQLIEQLHALRAWVIVSNDYAREQRLLVLGTEDEDNA